MPRPIRCLERLARARLRDGGRNTLLDTRGLVHESFLRYVQSGALRAEDRRAFFAFRIPGDALGDRLQCP